MHSPKTHSVKVHLKQQMCPNTVIDKVHFVQRLTGLKKSIKSRGQMKGSALHWLPIWIQSDLRPAAASSGFSFNNTTDKVLLSHAESKLPSVI